MHHLTRIHCALRSSQGFASLRCITVLRRRVNLIRITFQRVQRAPQETHGLPRRCNHGCKTVCVQQCKPYFEFLSGTRIYTCNASITAGKNRRRGGREPLRGPVLSQITISTETSRRVRTRQKRRRRVAERPGARRPSALTTHYDTLLHTTHLKPTTPPYQNYRSPAASATRRARRARRRRT